MDSKTGNIRTFLYKTKNGKQLRVGTPCRSLFPVFEDIVQSRIQCGFEALLHNHKDLCLQSRLVFLLFLFVLVISGSHFTLTLLSNFT